MATSQTDGFERFLRSTKQFNLDLEVMIVITVYVECLHVMFSV